MASRNALRSTSFLVRAKGTSHVPKKKKKKKKQMIRIQGSIIEEKSKGATVHDRWDIPAGHLPSAARV